MSDNEPLPLCVQGGHLQLEAIDDSSDFDPAEVTRLIGIEPHWSRKRDDPLQSGGGPILAPASWRILVPKREEMQTEVLVRELLDIIEPHANGMAEARRALGLNAGIYIDIDIYQELGVPQILLSAGTLKRLAGLEVWLYCEQYLY